MSKIEKNKILADIIAKQSDIIYKKVFVFVDGFVLSAMGVVSNLTKMGILYKELEDIKNGK